MPQVVDSFFDVMRSSAKPEAIQYIQKPLSMDAPAYIIPIGDVHLGHRKANLGLLNQILQYIYNTPNCYTVLIGDLAETATKTSVGTGMFDENFHLPQQMSYIKEMLAPLAAQQKIIGAVMGNHEYRIHQMLGMNPIGIICEGLNIPYSDYHGFAELYVGRFAYQVAFHHGVGGGSTEASKINAGSKQMAVVDADLYISGHTHARGDIEQPILYFENGLIKKKMRHVVSVGSFLEYFDNYPQMKMLPVSSIGPVCIELRHDAKEIHVYK